MASWVRFWNPKLFQHSQLPELPRGFQTFRGHCLALPYQFTYSSTEEPGLTIHWHNPISLHRTLSNSQDWQSIHWHIQISLHRAILKSQDSQSIGTFRSVYIELYSRARTSVKWDDGLSNPLAQPDQFTYSCTKTPKSVYIQHYWSTYVDTLLAQLDQFTALLRHQYWRHIGSTRSLYSSTEQPPLAFYRRTTGSQTLTICCWH